MEKTPWNSMEFHGVFGHGIPWSSMEKLYGIPWNYSMEFHGNFPWNSMEFHRVFGHGIPWRNSMELHGIIPWYLMETFGENSMELFRGIP